MSKTIHIWLGKFESKKEFTAFFKETYSDSKPLSQFAVSQGREFYDHDWLESYYKRKAMSQSRFLDERVPSNYSAVVEMLVTDQGITDANAIITFQEEWSGEPRSQDTNPTLWYLGEFNEKTLKALRPELDESALAIEEAWWTEFPGNDKELAALEKQSRKRNDQLPAAAKLALMYFSGIYVEKDKKIANKYLKKVLPYPELLNQCFSANGEAGNADAWLQLSRLHSREFEGAVSAEKRIEFLEKAIALDSSEAKSSMASMLMYSWIVPEVQEDRVRAEKLLLEVQEKDNSKAYELFCLYHMNDEDIYDPVKALHWLSISVEEDGNSAKFSRMQKFYADGKGVEKNPTLMSKFIYLSACQTANSNLAYYKDSMDAADVEEIKAGRVLAKQWIEARAGDVKRFEGELWDPFESYLADRRNDNATDSNTPADAD